MKKILVLVVSILLLMTSCKQAEQEPYDKIRDLEYTIVEPADLPDVLSEKINRDKKDGFKLSYSDGNFVYIAVGYGEQLTGGYSIQVDELYQSQEYIVNKTTLLGPEKDEKVVAKPSYPFVVVKTENIDLPICYQ